MLRLRHSSLLPAVFLVLAVCYSSSFATPPGLLSFQGRLTDPAGSPLNGTYTLTFVIYNVPNGGSPLWTETQTAVQVSDGLFQVNLGSVIGLSDAIFNDSSRYLGVTVGAGAELAPRTRLTSTAFSFRTQSVDGASGGTIRGGLFVVGNEYLTQELSATGFVGGFGLYGFNGTNPSPDNIGVKGVANGGDWNVGVLGMASDAATGSANSAGVYGVSAGIYGGTIWAG